MLLPVLLPRFRIRYLQHGISRLIYSVERIVCVELYRPTTFHVFDPDGVVPKDHLGRRDSQTSRHVLDRFCFEYRKLPRGDPEAILDDRISGISGRRVVSVCLGVVEGCSHYCDLR